MLSDAFNAAEETERDWDTDLREDVKGEVETKYGKVVEIFVLRESAVRLPHYPSRFSPPYLEERR